MSRHLAFRDGPPQIIGLNVAQLRVIVRQTPCAGCGERRGKHRYGDEACPNVHWKLGNGRPQWREGWRFRESRHQ